MTSKDEAEETLWDAKTSVKFENKRPGEYFDPCQEAAARSLKCLHRNGGDREMCTDYFQIIDTIFFNIDAYFVFSSRAYRDCKKQWITERKEAKRKAGKSWFDS